MLIAQALLRTSQIKLCPDAHLLPYHHPIELAHRVAFLDQLARGRYMLGVGISALPSDLALYGVDAAAGENRRMTLESLDIMLRLWRGEPFDFDGAFWRVRKPASSLDVDYLIERSWLVGSPDTVTRRLADLTRTTGGFGALLVMIYDFSSEPEFWNESLRLLTTEVMPHFS